MVIARSKTANSLCLGLFRRILKDVRVVLSIDHISRIPILFTNSLRFSLDAHAEEIASLGWVSIANLWW